MSLDLQLHDLLEFVLACEKDERQLDRILAAVKYNR